ncbi:MAG: hypothetical protein GEU82_02410 [Luteitalea sp.]|nr:hypothetical protein [Luteitalea sp.]
MSARIYGQVLFLMAHAPLGMLAYNRPQVSMVHAFLTLALGLMWALVGDSRPHRVAYVAAYIVGGEVLWRMTGAPIPWEFGKYAMVTVMVAWMIQNGRLKAPLAASLYFAFLLPSIVLTLVGVDLFLARQEISFALSGALAVLVAVGFFTQIQLSDPQRRQLYVSLLAPLVSIAAITVTATLLNPDITFGTESSVEASGGFGPNQVSAALGLGAMLAVLALTEPAAPWGFKPAMLACALLFTAQSAFTFSRGGLLTAGISALLGSLHLLSDSRARFRTLATAAGLGLLAAYLVFPALNAFTDGALANRFQDTGLTNRDSIASADIQIWQENLIFGVGPGQANVHREKFYRNTASHTEYSRMVAEHGLFGLVAFASLMVMVFQIIRKPRPVSQKALTMALSAWALLFMVSYGMRLAAPAFALGLAALPQGAALVPVLRQYSPFRAGVTARAGGRLLAGVSGGARKTSVHVP